VPVEFYAVPVDARGLDVTGEPVKLGTQTIPRIEPQGVVHVQQPWVATHPGGPGHQDYRIFAIVDRNNTLDSIHPWKDPSEPACPPTSVVGGKPAIDPMTGQTDALSCGQNKQGFGTVTVVPQPALQANPGAVDLRLNAASLRLERSAGALTGRARTVTFPAGLPAHGMVHVEASQTSDANRHVLIYDGSPAKGRLVAATTISGTDAESGSYARFTWTPTRRGRHTLYAVVPGDGDAASGVDTLSVVITQPHDRRLAMGR
jgi:hypothetical protein